MFARLHARIPSRADIAPVLATLLFLIYVFALIRFHWYVPSWLGYLGLFEVLSIAAYVMVYAMLESLGFLILLLLLAVVLPQHWFRNDFRYRASLAVWIVAGWSIYIHDRINALFVSLDGRDFAVSMTLAFGVVAISLAASYYLVLVRFPKLKRGFAGLTERIVVFLYVYIPLAGLASLVVVLRSLGAFVR